MKLKDGTNNKDVFAHMPVLAALRVMAVPTIISQIIVLIYNMADTFYVGRTNNPYMVAGASLILPVFNITLSLSGLMGVGGGTLISRLLGEKKEDEAKKVSAFCICLSILFTAMFSAGMGVFMNPVLSLLGAGENTRVYAGQYAFWVIVAGGIPTVLSNVLSNLLRSVGASRQAGFGITMGGLLNIVLDPFFMFVILPAGMEVYGVGIATFTSNCIACVYFFLVMRSMGKDSIVSFSLRRRIPCSKSIGAIFAVGVPSALSTLLFDLDYVVLDKLMASHGDIALAAVGIVLKAERLPLNVGIGICQGMLPLVAYNYSARNKKRMEDFIRYSMALGLFVAAVSVTLYEITAPFLIRVFIPDSATVALGADFLRARVLATPLMFLSFFTVHLFQAFGKGGKALFLGVMRWAVFNIPMLFLLNDIFGMYGLVWSQVTADILTVILSFFTYRKYGAMTEKDISSQ